MNNQYLQRVFTELLNMGTYIHNDRFPNAENTNIAIEYIKLLYGDCSNWEDQIPLDYLIENNLSNIIPNNAQNTELRTILISGRLKCVAVCNSIGLGNWRILPCKRHQELFEEL